MNAGLIIAAVVLFTCAGCMPFAVRDISKVINDLYGPVYELGVATAAIAIITGVGFCAIGIACLLAA